MNEFHIELDQASDFSLIMDNLTTDPRWNPMVYASFKWFGIPLVKQESK